MSENQQNKKDFYYTTNELLSALKSFIHPSSYNYDVLTQHTSLSVFFNLIATIGEIKKYFTNKENNNIDIFTYQPFTILIEPLSKNSGFINISISTIEEKYLFQCYSGFNSPAFLSIDTTKNDSYLNKDTYESFCRYIEALVKVCNQFNLDDYEPKETVMDSDEKTDEKTYRSFDEEFEAICNEFRDKVKALMKRAMLD